MEKVVKPFPHVPQHSPWLVFFSHGQRSKTQSFFSIVEGRSYVKNIPQLSRKTCLLFSHGWLLMAGPENEDSSLSHPTTMETIQLPPLPLGNQFPYHNIRCFFSSAPTDPNCVILLAAREKPQIMFLHLSQNTWRKVEYLLDDDPGGLYNLVTCNGKLYGMTYQGTLVIVDFDPDPNVRAIPEIPEPRTSLVTSRWDRSLVESSGEIFLVYKELTRTTCNVVTFNIYKLDLLKKKWVEVQSIGDDKAFFLCKTHSVSCSAIESGIRGDSIYYVCLEDPSLYQFDMVNRGIYVDLPCPNLNTPWYAPSWIFLDELCHSHTLAPSQESLQEPASSETDGLLDYSTIKSVVVKNELKTVVEASDVGPWSDPPQVVLELIVRGLTLADRLSMSRVCKVWSTIVPKIPAYNGLSYGFPCHASIDRDGKICTLVDPNCNEMHIKCQNLPSPCIILYSKDGWLLVLHPSDCEEEEIHSIFFFNPLTKAKIDLPNIKFPYIIHSFAFSRPPTSPDCVVIAVRPYCCNMSILHRGEREWTDLGKVDNISLMHNISPVFCKESLYCFANNGRLGIFDLSTQVWSFISNGTSMLPLVSGVKELYMTESDGELITVFTDKFGDKVRIQKLDPSRNQWEDIDTIGGRSLFVGERSSICSKGGDGLIGDGIYFPRIKDGAFMSYSMERRKFGSGGNFYGSKVFQLGFWIDPVFDSSYEEQIKWSE